MKHLAPGIAAALLLLAAAGTVGWWFTLRADALADRTRLERSISNAQDEVRLLSADLAQHESLEATRRTEIRTANADTDSINARIPDTADFTRMMRTISALGDQHALRIARIYHVDTTALPAGLQRLTYDITTTGTFEGTIAFINDLHRTPRHIAVTRFQLTTSSSGARNAPNSIPTITLNATISTLARSAPTPPDAPDTDPDADPRPDENVHTTPQGGPA